MQSDLLRPTTNRRNFLGKLALGAGAAGVASLAFPFNLSATPKSPQSAPDDPDAWFNKINGKHRMVFDVTGPHGIFPFAWSRVFLVTNQQTGSPEKDTNVVVVLRHEAIPFAMEDRLWAKYKLGEAKKIIDPSTGAPSVRNMFWQPKPGDFNIPGIGDAHIGINELQSSGVMFCVCNMAIHVLGNVIGAQSGTDPNEVIKDVLSGILPGIEIVPSGVWAVGRAQEHKCSYCFVG